MATGLLVALQKDQADLPAPVDAAEHLCPRVGLPVQDPGDQRPSRLDPSEPLPRQKPPGAPVGLSFLERSNSEEIPSYLSDNTTVTSADEEKVLLLNRNTELRQRNKELLELSRVWHATYHSTRAGLERQVAALHEDVAALRAQACKLSAQLDHEQSRREYYENTLFQELKHSQVMQEYVRQLEGQQLCSQRPPPPESGAGDLLPWEEPAAPPQCLPHRRWLKGKGMKPQSPAPLTVPGSENTGGRERLPCTQHSISTHSDGRDEVSALKDQLEALKYQTEIYKAKYRMEQEDRLRVKAENLQLQKEEEELRQWMALLEEQLRIFEDDFRKERSDKQVLQRLLKRNAGAQGPVLPPRSRTPGGLAGLTPPPARESRGKNGIVCPHCN
ncbi:uncharacterized protein LOC110080171 isoform X1 [Pogona vitticeps]